MTLMPTNNNCGGGCSDKLGMQALEQPRIEALCHRWHSSLLCLDGGIVSLPRSSSVLAMQAYYHTKANRPNKVIYILDLKSTYLFCLYSYSCEHGNQSNGNLIKTSSQDRMVVRVLSV